jgi:hypothetical protein
MGWRKADPSQAVSIAVIMAVPGLFAETARQLIFTATTGLPIAASPTFSAVIFFGNGVLLTYALIVTSTDRRSTVHDDDRAGHVGGGVGKHEDRGGGQFLRPAEALHRHALGDDGLAAAYMTVVVPPGHRQFTRTPLAAKSRAADRVMPTTACLLVV